MQEFAYSGTAIIPDLDSLSEFRIITNNFDAEYGGFAGGQVNVVTKTGADQLPANCSISCATRTLTRPITSIRVNEAPTNKTSLAAL